MVETMETMETRKVMKMAKTRAFSAKLATTPSHHLPLIPKSEQQPRPPGPPRQTVHTVLSGSIVNASYPETDTSVITVSFSDSRTTISPATPHVLTRQPSLHSTHHSLQALHPVKIPETRIGGRGDVSRSDCSLKQEVPIQRTGWLQTIDHEVEIRVFLVSHSANTRMVYTPNVALGHSQTEQ
jgi:hypothetical protein